MGSSRRLKLLCDMDGVVADLHATWIMKYNEKYNDCLTLEQVTDWEISKFVKPECGAKIFDFIRDPHVYKYVDPIPGAISTILDLELLGVRVVYITSCLDGTMDQKVDWLKRWGLVHSKYNSGKNFVATSDKSLVPGDVAIDDHARNLDVMVASHKLLFGQPFNQHNTQYPRVSWPQAFKIIQALV